MKRKGLPLSLDAFSDVVRRAVEGLPEPFRGHLENVVVDVELYPSREDLEILSERREDDPPTQPGDYLLLGLFVGVPLTEQAYQMRHPNRIKIFKRPLEQVSRNRRELLINIRKTVIHELAHHFGYSDEELREFDETPDPFGDEPL